MGSLKYAFHGLRSLYRLEHNFRIHLLATVLAISLGFILGLSRGEWLVLVLLIALVLVAEALNSALEHLADVVHPEKSEQIKKVKDYGAAAVLIAAIAALSGGIILFLPKIIEVLR